MDTSRIDRSADTRFSTYQRNTRNIILLTAVLVTIAACAGRVTRSVPESQKDTSGAYDGRWIGTIVNTSSPQRIGDWQMTCRKPNLEFNILVKNGQVSTRVDQDSKVAYINGNGKFRITIPSTSRATSSQDSESHLDSKITYFVEGTLGAKKPRGKFRVGISQFGNRGCESSIEYEKI